ncbi:hypothetical protein CVT24_004787 [Panaeolus cyanescens]|uniref:MYND-type domain-containing protein n=1 Tax=Panaeolus cyanescens TaxID=181874 RepID=A0A409V9V4_9AGAR|nr:hypothetical protein CVT24_004787 [Panaeolus cyanescens]
MPTHYNRTDEEPPAPADLHDLVVLLMYEWGTTDPRFRHSKLIEVSSTSFQTIKNPDNIDDWRDTDPSRRIGLLFHKPKAPKEECAEDRDLPSNMLPDIPRCMLKPSVLAIKDSERQLETYFWQARAHDGCMRSVVLMQHFVHLLTLQHDLQVRIRTLPSTRNKEPRKPVEYVTSINCRMVHEFSLYNSELTTISLFLSQGCLITGDPGRTPHVVLGFRKPNGPTLSILDMSSLQYGEVGRGHKGHNFFILESIEDYAQEYLPKFAEKNTFATARTTYGVHNVPRDVDEYLKDVAARAKKRWDSRRESPFCAYCGGPPKPGAKMMRCSACKTDHYCSPSHQKAGWYYHKHFCKREEIASSRTVK